MENERPDNLILDKKQGCYHLSPINLSDLSTCDYMIKKIYFMENSVADFHLYES